MSNNIINHETRREDWGTPRDLFAALRLRFDFFCDLAADVLNAVHSRFIYEQKCIFSADSWFDVQNWAKDATSPPYAWINPPYRPCGETGDFTARAAEIADHAGCGVIALIPASVGTVWWREHVAPHYPIVCFTRRLRFEGASATAQFDTALACKPAPGDSIERCAGALEPFGLVYERRHGKCLNSKNH